MAPKILVFVLTSLLVFTCCLVPLAASLPGTLYSQGGSDNDRVVNLAAGFTTLAPIRPLIRSSALKVIIPERCTRIYSWR